VQEQDDVSANHRNYRGQKKTVKAVHWGHKNIQRPNIGESNMIPKCHLH
jgi:hypothetical protein